MELAGEHSARRPHVETSDRQVPEGRVSGVDLMAGVILVPDAVERMQLFECRLHGEWPGFSVNLWLSARPTASKTFVLPRVAGNGAFRGPTQ